MEKEDTKKVIKKFINKVLDEKELLDAPPQEDKKEIENKTDVKKDVSLSEQQGVEKEEKQEQILLKEKGGESKKMSEKKKEKEPEKVVLKEEVPKKDQINLKEELDKLKETYNADMDTLRKELTDNYSAKLKGAMKQTEETDKRLAETEKRLADRDKELHVERVTKSTDKLLSEGVWPATVSKAKAIMLEDYNGNFSSIKLEEGEDKPSVSLSDAIIEMLSTIPKDVKLSFDEVSKTDKSTEPTKKLMDLDDVKKYALDEKLSFDEACAKLTADGKIEMKS